MIVFASTQLWPNLAGLHHWHHKRGGVSDLFIYYTNSVRESWEPAKRLYLTCREVFSAVTVHALDQACGSAPTGPFGIMPIDAVQICHSWMQARPEIETWIINATGGLKLLFNGAASFVGDAKCQVIYREIVGGWFELKPSSSGGLVHPVPFSIAVNETDSLPVKELVTMQFEQPEGTFWEHHTPDALDLHRLTTLGFETEWDWKAAFQRAGYDHATTGGVLFEKYVAAALRAFGLPNVVSTLKLQRRVGHPKEIAEIDLAANYGGRLIIFDCKLRSEQESDALVTQIHDAAERRRALGGLNAECLFLRPNQLLSDAHRALAEARGLKVLDEKDKPRFFPKLGELLGKLALPDHLASVQALLEAKHREGLRIFTGPPERYFLSRQAEEMPGVLDLVELLRLHANEAGQSWGAARFRDRLFLCFRRDDGIGVVSARQALARAVCAFACVEELDCARQGSWFYGSLRLSSPESGEIAKRWLESRRKAALIEITAADGKLNVGSLPVLPGSGRLKTEAPPPPSRADQLIKEWTGRLTSNFNFSAALPSIAEVTDLVDLKRVFEAVIPESERGRLTKRNPYWKSFTSGRHGHAGQLILSRLGLELS